MKKKIVYTEDAPAPIGPYSQGVLVNNTLYVSGQIALDAKSGKMINDSLENETLQVMLNLKAVLEAAGMGFEHIVKCSIFLKDMEYFDVVNTVYGKYFEVDAPARETVAVRQLPKNVNVEISCVAVK